MNYINQILQGSCLDLLPLLPAESVHTCVTSPPYFGLRDYGAEGQLGIEETPAAYVANLVAVLEQVKRVLRPDGTLWLNLGDSYANDTKHGGGTTGKHARALHGGTGIGRNRHLTGLPSKSLIGIPWRVAFALQEAGWVLRQDIIWHKPSPMPESVTDRCTKSHEYIFMLTKSSRYYFDQAAIREPASGKLAGNVTNKYTTVAEAGEDLHRTKLGLVNYAQRQRSKRDSFKREVVKGEVLVPNQSYTQHREGREESAYDLNYRNKRSVWTVATRPYSEAHFATFPPDLIAPCILAGAPPDGIVLDPFLGAGTTALVALRAGRRFIGCELNPEYVAMAEKRIAPYLHTLFTP